MGQFTAHRNPNPATRGMYPLLLDVQSDWVMDLATRVVVPLTPLSGFKAAPVKGLMPVLTIQQREYVMVTPQLAGVRRQDIGAPVADLSEARGQIIAALDLLITGY